MMWLFMVRFYYGYFDVWDKVFIMINGGVFKVLKMIYVVEDFFGGVNVIVCGG